MFLRYCLFLPGSKYFYQPAADFPGPRGWIFTGLAFLTCILQAKSFKAEGRSLARVC